MPMSGRSSSRGFHCSINVNLVEAQVVLTGLRPEVAQTLVSLGVDLSDIVTRGTLQSGIAYGLRPGLRWTDRETRRQGDRTNTNLPFSLSPRLLVNG